MTTNDINVPLILAVAPNGARKTKADHPAVPIGPVELAAEAARCREVGAAMIHLHVRDADDKHSLDADAYAEATAAVRREVGDDMIIQMTTEAVGIYSSAQQIAAVRTVRPEAASLAVGEFCPDEAAVPAFAEFLTWMAAERIMPQYILYGPEDAAQFVDLRKRGVILRAGALYGGSEVGAGGFVAVPGRDRNTGCRLGNLRLWGPRMRLCPDGGGAGWPCPGWFRKQCSHGRRFGGARQCSLGGSGRGGCETAGPAPGRRGGSAGVSDMNVRATVAGLLLASTGLGLALADNHKSNTTVSVGGDAREIVIGAGAVSGVYFPAAGAICRVVSARDPGSRCFVESNANSSANIERLASGLLDFAIVQSDWLMHAARGTNLFHASGADENLRAVMALHAEPLTLVARAGASIAGPADLEGKRISIGPAFTYQRVLMEALLRAWDIGTNDLALVLEITAMEQFSALCAGEIDAAAIVTAHPSPALGAAMQRCDLKLVPVEGEEVDKLLSRRPDLAKATIPGGTYTGALDEVPAFGLRAVLATTVNVDDGLVRQLTGAVLDSMAEFTGQHPVLADVGSADGTMASAGISLPLHPGAEAAYRARGLLPAE
jgi:TRAP transporter TAXI family solute receptor